MPRLLPTLLGPHRIDSKFLVTFLGLALGLLGMFWLGSEVLEGDTFALDKLILRGLRTDRDPGLPIGPVWLKATAIDITALGGVTVLTFVTVLVVGYLVADRKAYVALFVATAIASGAVVSSGLKAFFVRARPELVPHLVEVTSASFPSGHAMNSAMVYLTLAALVARSQELVTVRIYLISIAILLTILVGATRVYLGVHWPSDVIAGWCIGAIWAVLCSLIAKFLVRRQKIKMQ
ncbi:phosphatase PAP2 family protein [Sphingorhabdus sp.]|uniref:phosphatase PAP2 family protein n=1 Tax=Sphingorhabdus sp. TaxID=1902408 RepID=UPI0039839C5F